MQPLSKTKLTALSAILLLALHNGATASTQALVVGIDDYQHQKKLEGAVNDANLIVSALEDNGVKRTDIHLLKNQDASKEAIHTTWLEMLAKAQRGDTLIFSFAGHGGQEKDLNGDEEDGNDEHFQLAGFSTAPRIGSAADRIVDDELYQWLYETKAKGVQAIVVADACHSGTITRSMGDNAEEDLSEKDLPPPDPVSGANNTAPQELDNIILLSSSADRATTPEFLINDKMHGALSWAFAHAIKGNADLDRNNQLTKGELVQYVREVTKEKSNSTQQIGAEPRGSEDLVLLATQQVTSPEISGQINLKILDGKADTPLTNTLSTDDSTAELRWDAKKGLVWNKTQEPIAQGIKTSADMQAIIDKYLLLKQVAAYIQQGNIAESRLLPNDAIHQVGDKLTFVVDKIRYPYLTQFNLTGNGTVQFLYPLKSDKPAISIPQWEMQLEVTNSLGGEGQLISIFSEQPLPALQAMLETTNDRKASRDLLAILPETLKGMAFQISQIDHFTEE